MDQKTEAFWVLPSPGLERTKVEASTGFDWRMLELTYQCQDAVGMFLQGPRLIIRIPGAGRGGGDGSGSLGDAGRGPVRVPLPVDLVEPGA